MKAVLHPISVQWENAYSQPSEGSMVLATEDPAAEDIWSGSTGIYISQVMPDGTRRPRFGGFIPKFAGAGGGATTVAFHSIDKFLEKRILAGVNKPYELLFVIEDNLMGGYDFLGPGLITPDPSPGSYSTVIDYSFTPGSSADIAALLVNLARGNIEGEGVTGIPTLTGVVEGTNVTVPATSGQYKLAWWDFKNIGQAIRELVEAEGGIKYRLDHSFNNGYWETEMVFSDTIGTERDYTILSDREAWEYGLEVDASEKATRVYGIGEGDEWNTLFSIAYDADTSDNLPEHQVTAAWKDQTDLLILDGLTRGYVTDHRDPATVPSATIVGLPTYDPDAPDFDPSKGFPGPEICEPGDTVGIEIGYGVITVKDIRARILAVAWQLQQTMTAQRTLAFQPVIRVSDRPKRGGR